MKIIVYLLVEMEISFIAKQKFTSVNKRPPISVAHSLLNSTTATLLNAPIMPISKQATTMNARLETALMPKETV